MGLSSKEEGRELPAVWFLGLKVGLLRPAESKGGSLSQRRILEKNVGGMPQTTAFVFVLESLKNPFWCCQWGLMETLSITPCLSTEKYDCRVNQPLMNCMR